MIEIQFKLIRDNKKFQTKFLASNNDEETKYFDRRMPNVKFVARKQFNKNGNNTSIKLSACRMIFDETGSIPQRVDQLCDVVLILEATELMKSSHMFDGLNHIKLRMEK